MSGKHFLRLPVVSAGAEHLVMGYLMRRNILTYKAPPNNEGYEPFNNEARFELIAEKSGSHHRGPTPVPPLDKAI